MLWVGASLWRYEPGGCTHFRATAHPYNRDGLRYGAMKRSGVALLAVLALGAPLRARAEALPPPVGGGDATVKPAQQADTGFAADVEQALDGFSTLQCTVLGILFMNSQACNRP